MDPLTFAAAGLTGAKGILSSIGLFGQNRAMKHAYRMQQMQLRQNADTVVQQAGFEVGRLSDQIDRVYGQQMNFYAGGNLDPTTGSPAIVQAMTAAQGEADKALIVARGANSRADMFQKIADIEGKITDSERSMVLGIGTEILSTASKWIGLARQDLRGPQGGGNTGGGNTGGGNAGGWNGWELW